ncbi:MAG: hypothetical protein M0C28_15420 [Candidatus Moduliflexus flocculans]|nr:hypothetical protein [Candidatus Moduliflexus flocculans]
MSLRVTSRSLEDLLAFINNLTARGFKDIQVFGETGKRGRPAHHGDVPDL